MSSQQSLKDQVDTKKTEIDEIAQKISALTHRIHTLSVKYNIEAAKVQRKITKVQFSRPRGNPANQWPHRPMTHRIQAFYQAKEREETSVRQQKDLLKQTFDHSRAIMTCESFI